MFNLAKFGNAFDSGFFAASRLHNGQKTLSKIFPNLTSFKHFYYSRFKLRKAKKIWGTREKSSLFPYIRTAFFSGTPNFFDPSYFEVAL